MKTDVDKLLLDASPDAVMAISADGKVLYWSKGAEAIRLLSDIIVPPDRIDEERSLLREAINKGSITYESIRCAEDGSLVYVDITSRAVRDEHGNVEFVLSSKKNVTELKVVRDAKFAEAKFRDLLESVPDGIVMVNPTGRIVLSNTRAEELFGYQRGELRGMAIELLLPVRFRQNHIEHCARFFAQPRTRYGGGNSNCSDCARTAPSSRWRSA